MQETRANSRLSESDADRKVPPQVKLLVVESSGDQDAPGGAWAAIARVVFGTQFLAIADQVVVSGTSLLSTVLVGRFTVPSELGIYSTALPISWFTLAIQDALMLLP